MRRLFTEAVDRNYYGSVFLFGGFYACAIVFLSRSTQIQIFDNLLVFLLVPVYYASVKFETRKYILTSVIVFTIAVISIYCTSGYNDFMVSFYTAFAYLSITGVFCEIIYRSFQSRRFVLYQNQKLAEALEKAHLEMKAIREHIPMCASCKKIRDDKGEWLQNEVFLMRYFRIEFTHSICPECMKKLYPDYVVKKDSNPHH